MNKIKFFISLVFILIPSLSFAQNDSVKVMQTINRLFDGMRTGNYELVSAVLDTNAVLMSIGKALGKTSVHSQTAEQFIRAIGFQHKEKWEEKLFDPILKLKENIATVWAEYSFYLNDKLHHCGIDSFQLVKRDEGWKILVIVDTRKKEGCEK